MDNQPFIEISVKNFLMTSTDLIESYAEPEIEIKADAIFAHLMTRTRHSGWGLHH